MNPIEKLEELRRIVLGDKIDHPAWDWIKAKFNSLRDDIAAQQKKRPTCWTQTAGTSYSTPEDDSAPEVLSTPPTSG